MKRALSLVAVFFGLSLCFAAAGSPSNTQTRVEAQRALDRVAFGHQVMPPGTSASAVSFEQAYPASASSAKVEKALLESKALEVYWQRPITGEQLQAEMDRMVKGSKDPKVLAEMFSALRNDPHAIAEYLARPLLADRLCRQWYARDERFHGALKSKAQIQLEGLTAETLRSTDGQYTEYEIKEDASGTPAERFGEIGSLDSSQWKSAVSHLADALGVRADAENLPVGRVSALQEDDTRFYALAVLQAAPHGVKAALVQWPKASFDLWLNQQRGALGIQEPASTSSAYRLAPLPEAAAGANDTWSPMTQAPQERQNHSAVWTGTEMIVWGGAVDPLPLNTGSRYNPATDTWTLTSTLNAPEARYRHSAVWTGTRMIVWGGFSGIYATTGGSYDPVTDTWTAIANSSGTVSGRYYNSTVWTGIEMIVWGGQAGGVLVNTGGAYNPSTNLWRALSSPTVGAVTLAARYKHACVWTGSKMIIWGGMDQSFSPVYFVNGMLYDPSTDSWTLMSTAILGARSDAFTVWTGTEMIQWGGEQGGAVSGTGTRYNPLTDTWAAISTTGAPSARETFYSTGFAWWTGSSMIVWGGWTSAGASGTGGRYSPSTDSWLPTSTVNAQPVAYWAASVWTGSEMIVWGGIPPGITPLGIVGGRYNPVTDSWVRTTGYNIPVPRRGHASVWTGTEVVIWGGDDGGNTPVTGGGRYNPAMDAWSPMSALNAPLPRTKAGALWTGTEMIVWGGMTDQYGTPTDTGGVYNAGTDTWRSISLLNAPVARNGASFAWTGTRMVVWGGTDSSSTPLNTGGQYDLAADSWTPTSRLGSVARWGHSTVWTGTEMIAWGGYAPIYTVSNTGQRYNPATDTWTDVTTVGAPDARALHSAVWTGAKMLVWGGSAVTLGAIYDPAADAWSAMSSAGAPADRYNHVALWTGSEMIIWGGTPSAGVCVNTGGRYRPSADVWTSTTLVGAPTPRGVMPGVWTGSSMVVWSGQPEAGLPSCSGGRYWMTSGPAVTGVIPNAGPASGGTTVTITGNNLTGASSVTFGGTAAASFVVNTDTQITAVSPAHAVGTVDIIVTTAEGSSAAVPADQYTYTSAPVLNLQSNSFTDACVVGGPGSADGFIDPGEDITLNVTLSNTGTLGATNVQAVLASTTPGVFISSGTAAFPDIPFGGTGSTMSPYAFHVDASHACGDTLAFTLQITSAEGTWPAIITLTVGHFGPPATITLFSENFETSGGVLPAGWATEVVAGNAWTVGGSPLICSASLYALQYVSAAVGADSWAYTPGQALTAGVTYTLSFSERVAMAIRTHNLSVFVGTAQSRLSMTTQIWSAVLNNGACATKTVSFTVPASGTYYIGFHETSLASRLTMAVDDVSVTYPGLPQCLSTPCASAAPVVMTQPASQTVCTGSSVSFTAVASGVPAPTVQWEVSTDSGTTWNNVPGATLDTLTFTASAAENGDQYRAVYTSTSGIATSSAATLTVNGAPAMTTQPVSQTACPGSTVSFTAAASGTPAVQWQVSTDGGTTWSDVAGATSATLSFTAAASENGYQYHAVFLGNCGMAVSNAATLSLNVSPAVTTQPSNQTVCSGSSVSFTASASGTPAPAVQWQVSTDGGTTWANAGGAASGTLTFTAAASQNGYQYHAVFTNTCGTATGNAATLTVNTAPAVTTQPVSQTVTPGVSVSFTASASGVPVPTVQWQVSTNGGGSWSDIPGATSTTLTFTAQASENGYQYHAVFTNACGSATSNAATLTTNSAPSVTTQPASQTACSGSSVSFTAAASGTPAPTVQWQVSTNGGGTWSDVPGATSGTLTFTAQASENGYQYHAVFTNVAGTATSNAATLAVNTAAAITANPVNQSVVIGASVTFTAAASGSPAPTLQWQVSTNGGSTWGDVPGAASTTLTFTAQASENGYQYRAVFTNTCGTATSNAATLAVLPALAVTAAGAPLNGQAPVSVTFTGSASGGDGGPYTYDWNFGDGSPHSTAQNPTHIYNVKGAFTVIFTTTDSSGHTASDSHLVANITVGAVPVVLNFYDDAGRARLCLNRLTGEYRWTANPGTPNEVTFTGVATVVNGGAKAYSKPGDPYYLNSTYDARRKRASANFSAPGVYSTLSDLNTTNNPPGCY